MHEDDKKNHLGKVVNKIKKFCFRSGNLREFFLHPAEL
uniref:Uncharacterized protein n=2 Tax=Klebsiella TaxID=570 RepID=A0A1J0QZQ5_KLEPN|nr:hypothetical protein [Klebsiella pneumoniae]AVX35294.1 Hypothetical protein [Klebsiella aerogenes]